jgi:hypothetical protein
MSSAVYFLLRHTDGTLEGNHIVDHALEFPGEVAKHLRHKFSREHSKHPGELRINDFIRCHGAAALHVDVEAALPDVFEFAAFRFAQDFSNDVLAQYNVQPGIDQRPGHHAYEVLPPVAPLDGATFHGRTRGIIEHEIVGEPRKFADLFDYENGKESGEWIITKSVEFTGSSPPLLDMRNESFVLYKTGFEVCPR